MAKFADLPAEVIRRIVKQDLDNSVQDGKQRMGAFPHRLVLNRLIHHIVTGVLCQCAVIRLTRLNVDPNHAENPAAIDPEGNSPSAVRIWSNMGYIVRNSRQRSVRALMLVLWDDPHPSMIYSALHQIGLFTTGLVGARTLIVDYMGGTPDGHALFPPQQYDVLSTMLAQSLPNINSFWFLGKSVGAPINMLFRMLVSRCVRPVENFIIDMNYSYKANGLQLPPQTSSRWFQPTLMNPAVRLPNLFAESLEALTMHSICTPMLWHKFFATPASPTLSFTKLRSLSLRFNPEVMEAPRLTHRYQHIAFPALTKLSLACYNFNIDILLSIFPKHQIQVLEVCQDWNRFKIDLSLFASLERLTVNDRGYAVRNGVQAQHWFTNSVCSILPFRLLSHLEVHSLRAYDLPRALALPCFANLKRLGISCSHDSTLIPRFLLPDVLYARGYVPIHAGIRHVTVRGPVLEGDINRRCVQQLVCIWAGMPGLQFVTLTQSFKKHMDYFKFEIKALVQSESLGRHVQHLNSIYVQFP